MGVELRLHTSDYTSVPLSGHSRLMNTDTFSAYSAIFPIINFDSPANSVSFNYGQYHSTSSPVNTIDLVFTVTVSNDPFTDGLYLTNQVRAAERWHSRLTEQ